MKFITVDNYEKLSRMAANIIAAPRWRASMRSSVS